jgi:GH3 auxin-responsive promoter
MSHAAVVDAFTELARAPRAAQARTLADMIAAARASRFGQAHGFDRLRDADDYRARVPLSTYEDLRAWLEQDAGALTGERPLALLTTSASTGKPKAIPYTARFRDSIRAAHDVFSAACFRDFPDLPLGRGPTPRAIGLYQVSAPAAIGPGNVPLDSYVSRLFDVALPEDPFFFALPRQVYAVPDARRRLYIMMLLGADWDLRALRATNPTTLLLFARVLAESTEALVADLAAPERARLEPAVRALARPRPDLARKLALLDRPLRPRDLWPRLELLVTWRGGTCGLYERFLHEQFGPVRIRAPIFAASEGVVAIPLADEMAGGVPALASSFFEFRPLEDSARTLLVDELEPGARYELVLTSPAGMYRYLIGDIVEVEGRYQACPTIRFVARKGRTSSLTGEKLTELQVEDAVARASARVGCAPMFWLLSPAIAARPSYVLCVDWGALAAAPEVGALLARSVDEELARLNVEYRAKRDSDRLGPVALLETVPGEFERLQAGGLSGGRAANYKLPHLASEPVHETMRALVR